jgi:hypothetical protein
MNRIKHALILTVDFIGLLIILSAIFFTLNYFKVLPLSTTFPKYFGFLPQISKEKSAETLTPAPESVNIKWDKQAQPALVSNFSDYFKIHNISITTIDENNGLFLVKGVLSAYNKHYFQIVTSLGITFFQIDKSNFRKISPTISLKSKGSDPTNRTIATYKNSADFFSDVPFGGYLEIIFTLNGNIKSATNVDYYPAHNF